MQGRIAHKGVQMLHPGARTDLDPIFGGTCNMISGVRRAVAAVSAVGILLPCLVVLLGGCGHKEEAPPANSGYYSGPMKPKGAPASAQGGTARKTAPASNLD